MNYSFADPNAEARTFSRYSDAVRARNAHVRRHPNDDAAVRIVRVASALWVLDHLGSGYFATVNGRAGRSSSKRTDRRPA